MNAPTDPARSDGPQLTLGDLLYADRQKHRVAEAEWVALVSSIANGDQAALRALYERAHRIVFTLIVRITANRQAAEELTLDVFHDAWRRAPTYDPANGPVLGWLMNQARSRALDRLRYDQRKKRVAPAFDATTGAHSAESSIEFGDQRQMLLGGLATLTTEERQAIETAFFSELTYVETAERLNQPVGTIKSRIRSGLEKLRKALDSNAEMP